GEGVGDGEGGELSRPLRPRGVLGALEVFTAIGALALEHRARIMQAVGEHVQRGLAPGDELAVVPDDPLEAVVRFFCHGASPRRRSGARAPDRPRPYAFASRVDTRDVSARP